MNATQVKIIDLARDFIQQVGYQSFNYKQIANVLNIKHPAIHHYYPQKEDLGLAVIEKDKADFEQMTRSLTDATPTEKTESILSLYTHYFTNGQKMCVVSTCGAIYEELPGKMQTGIKGYLEVIVSWLTDTFKEGLATGEFTFRGSAEDMAALWSTMLPGTLLGGRLAGEAYFHNIIIILRKTLKGN